MKINCQNPRTLTLDTPSVGKLAHRKFQGWKPVLLRTSASANARAWSGLCRPWNKETHNQTTPNRSLKALQWSFGRRIYLHGFYRTLKPWQFGSTTWNSLRDYLTSQRCWVLALELAGLLEKHMLTSLPSHGLPCQSAPKTRRLQLSHGPFWRTGMGWLTFWDGMGWDVLPRFFSHPQIFSSKTSPKLNDSLLAFHWHVGHSNSESVLGLVDQRILQRRNSFGHNLNKSRRREPGANPSLVCAPRGNCQGQRFGESCDITCRPPREVSSCELAARQDEKHNHTMAIQYSLTFLVLPINKFTHSIGDNNNNNNLPNTKISWNFSYQSTSLPLLPLPSGCNT